LPLEGRRENQQSRRLSLSTQPPYEGSLHRETIEAGVLLSYTFCQQSHCVQSGGEHARTKRKDIDWPKTAAGGDLIGQYVSSSFDFKQCGVIVTGRFNTVDDTQGETTGVAANGGDKITTA
jgi:hypothetical protein